MQQQHWRVPGCPSWVLVLQQCLAGLAAAGCRCEEQGDGRECGRAHTGWCTWLLEGVARVLGAACPGKDQQSASGMAVVQCLSAAGRPLCGQIGRAAAAAAAGTNASTAAPHVVAAAPPAVDCPAAAAAAAAVPHSAAPALLHPPAAEATQQQGFGARFLAACKRAPGCPRHGSAAPHAP
jgi:hypothetical protein